ncbi:MAG TPA: hypothetical protein VK841_18595, partial [Polyangiaceae bacterium]|nr:hypothetical protein [Polyangiaceae bacterium]
MVASCLPATEFRVAPLQWLVRFARLAALVVPLPFALALPSCSPGPATLPLGGAPTDAASPPSDGGTAALADSSLDAEE